MSKQEQNIAIAKALGIVAIKGSHPRQFDYPEKYGDLCYCIPRTTVPDFVAIIDNALTFMRRTSSLVVNHDFYTHKK